MYWHVRISDTKTLISEGAFDRGQEAEAYYSGDDHGIKVDNSTS